MIAHEKRAIGLIGQGLIYQQVLLYLKSHHRIHTLTTESPAEYFASCALVVFCSDNWSPAQLQKVNHCCLEARVALLPIYTQFQDGIIGPLVEPMDVGCVTCAELRKLGATQEEDDAGLLRQALFHTNEPGMQQLRLTSGSLELLVQLVGQEIVAHVQSTDRIRTKNALLYIDLNTLNCSRHHFIPLPNCPDCGGLIDDSSSAAEIVLESRPKPDPFTYRTQQLIESKEQLFTMYVDSRAGMIHSINVYTQGWLPFVLSRLTAGDSWLPMTGTGCTLRLEHDKVVAVAEALERYAGRQPRGKRTVVRASYNQLVQYPQSGSKKEHHSSSLPALSGYQTNPNRSSDCTLGTHVLDPHTLGLYSVQQYEQLRDRFVPYTHDLICNWVWGYSFRHQRPILVPESCVYYGLPRKGVSDTTDFVYEISNGCAIGNCLEEAIFHGIQEIAERDAFLLTWYAQLKLTRLDPLSVTHPALRVFIKHIEHYSGYTIYVFQATLDHAFPCLWVMGVDEKNREGMPKVRCGAGSSIVPEQALFNALRELAVGLSTAPASYQQRKEHAREMLADADLVKTMKDHATLYYRPEAFERLDFLYHAQQPAQTFQEAFPTFYQNHSECMDLREDLTGLIDHYLAHNIDTIVIDQTAPEHALHGFRCVKVLMPGMLPMTFGQRYRRITGLPRLYQLPTVLGYRQSALNEEEINPYPHPFP